jgi:hypothetical protein
MRTQQVSDHTRNAPVHALRAVFSGVGQLFLAADRLKRQDGEAGQAQDRWRSLDQTGNVRLLTAEDLAEEFGDPSPAAPPAFAYPEPVPVPEPEPAPLENYDELSLPSLRARLRGLDAGQVAELAAYERAHAARADVVTMFERRIEKLTAVG